MAQASPREGIRTKPVRVHVAKAAQEFIEEHYWETVHIEDICRETGVGVRTLQRCFQDYFGITLTAYLTTVRLDAAHRALAVADPVLDSVTNIALHHGFTHLGRFSVEFRRRFGERPSETLAMRNGR